MLSLLRAEATRSSSPNCQDQKRSHFEKSSTITTTQKSFKETVTNYREEDRLKEEAKKQETNCVTKDKKGNCPPPPKSEKPTPKKPVEKKDEAAKK